MKNYSTFDILGPIMIGPSSSHTAGAARLAKIAATIAENDVAKVRFLLHGSFAKTYKGHGTDRALVAGILGMDPWDDNLKNSFAIAKDKGIEFSFEEADLGDVHPNTVKFIITNSKGENVEITGSSIGGGNIVVFDVDGEKTEFTGEYPTLIITMKDTPGMIYKISTLLFNENINIAFMNVYRKGKGSQATMVIEADSAVPQYLLEEMKKLDEIVNIEQIVPPVKGEQ